MRRRLLLVFRIDASSRASTGLQHTDVLPGGSWILTPPGMYTNLSSHTVLELVPVHFVVYLMNDNDA